MTDENPSQKRSKISSVLLGLVGLVIIGLAFVGRRANLIGFEEVGGMQIALLLLGGFLIAIAIYRDRVLKAYQTAAVILLNTVLLILIIELVVIAAMNVVLGGQPNALGAAWDLPYYQEQPWGQQYWDEHGLSKRTLQYAPYVAWEQGAFSSDLVNITAEHTRFTPATQCDNPDAYTVFMFGGSTMWGYGAPDWGTIPAYVQTALNTERDAPVCVVNYGMLGYVNTQEVALLTRLLAAGHIPDVVVFYDGINDVNAAFSIGIAGVHTSYNDYAQMYRRGRTISADEWLRDTYIGRLVGAWSAEQSAETSASTELTLDEAVIRNYAGNVEVVKALAGGFGFDYYFIWQPALVVSEKPRTVAEDEVIDPVPSNLRTQYQRIYALAEVYADTEPHVIYLGDFFDNEAEFRYFDFEHIVPEGNEEIATAIVNIMTEGASNE